MYMYTHIYKDFIIDNILYLNIMLYAKYCVKIYIFFYIIISRSTAVTHTSLYIHIYHYHVLTLNVYIHCINWQ